MGTYADLMKRARQERQGDKPQTIEVEVKPSSPSPTVEPLPKTDEGEQNVRLLESESVRNLTSQNVRLLDFVSIYLELKNETLMGFRYPQALLDKLDELEFDLKRKYGKRVPRTTILVTAIAFLLWDHKKNGDASTLAQVMQTQNK